MIGPVQKESTLATTRPGQMVGADYMQLSGTSFSAAVVSGVAADLFVLHPRWTPDQIKGALATQRAPIETRLRSRRAWARSTLQQRPW